MPSVAHGRGSLILGEGGGVRAQAYAPRRCVGCPPSFESSSRKGTEYALSHQQARRMLLRPCRGGAARVARKDADDVVHV